MNARAHPNVLKVNSWLNNLYHFKSGEKTDDVDLSCPLVYADRFRIRHPGGQWNSFPPHIDGVLDQSRTAQWTKYFPGGSTERWEDNNFRRCFTDILTGNWRQHDPYDLAYRLNARSSLYGRTDQVCCRTLILIHYCNSHQLLVKRVQDFSGLVSIEVEMLFITRHLDKHNSS